MSLVAIRAALDKRLATLTPALPVHHEGTLFQPVVGEPYLRTWLLPATPDTALLGRRWRNERGIYQVTLVYPFGQGPGAAAACAERLRNLFARGLTLSQGGVAVLIEREATVGPAADVGGTYQVAVSIAYSAQIFD